MPCIVRFCGPPAAAGPTLRRPYSALHRQEWHQAPVPSLARGRYLQTVSREALLPRCLAPCAPSTVDSLLSLRNSPENPFTITPPRREPRWTAAEVLCLGSQ